MKGFKNFIVLQFVVCPAWFEGVRDKGSSPNVTRVPFAETTVPSVSFDSWVGMSGTFSAMSVTLLSLFGSIRLLAYAFFIGLNTLEQGVLETVDALKNAQFRHSMPQPSATERRRLLRGS